MYCCAYSSINIILWIIQELKGIQWWWCARNSNKVYATVCHSYGLRARITRKCRSSLVSILFERNLFDFWLVYRQKRIPEHNNVSFFWKTVWTSQYFHSGNFLTFLLSARKFEAKKNVSFDKISLDFPAGLLKSFWSLKTRFLEFDVVKTYFSFLMKTSSFLGNLLFIIGCKIYSKMKIVVWNHHVKY